MISISKEEKKKCVIRIILSAVLLIILIFLKIYVFDYYETDDQISTGLIVAISGYLVFNLTRLIDDFDVRNETNIYPITVTISLLSIFAMLGPPVYLLYKLLDLIPLMHRIFMNLGSWFENLGKK